ncbi:MAG: hypothetical protein ACTSVY_06800 [Candidatus Helarchaeota archaeon]
MGILGVISSFLLFWIAEDVWMLNRAVIQTLIFLKLTVAGHMTIYLTRSYEHNFWEKPFPSMKLFITSEITQLIATLFAVYGIAMTPIGWFLAGIVWLYALAWFFINDFIKVFVYQYTNGRKINGFHLNFKRFHFHRFKN